MKRIFLFLLLGAAQAAMVFADKEKVKGPPSSGEGPYFHEIYTASSPDGLKWTHDNKRVLEHASVPAAVVTPEGYIRVYYVDATLNPEQTNCAQSRDNGQTWEVLHCRIERLQGGRPLDPCVVRLKNDAYRLYYYSSSKGSPDKPGKHQVASALSKDGVTFFYEGTVFDYDGLVDPDVFWNGQEWLMFVFSLEDRETVVASSKDGKSFEYEGPLKGLKGWGTTKPVKLQDGRFRLYAFKQPDGEVTRSFVSSDGRKWTQEEGIRLTPPQGKSMTDPFVVRLKDGTWKMVFKVSAIPKAKKQQPN